MNYYLGILERNSQLCTLLRRILDTRKIRSHSGSLHVRPVSLTNITSKKIEKIFTSKSIDYQLSKLSLFSHRGVQIQPWMITIVAGELRLWQPTATGQRRGVEKIHVHPNFNTVTLENDLTILAVRSFANQLILQTFSLFTEMSVFPAQNSVQIDTRSEHRPFSGSHCYSRDDLSSGRMGLSKRSKFYWLLSSSLITPLFII